MGRGTDRGLEEPRLPLLSQSIALTFNIDRDGMVEEPVENRRGDDRIAKHVAPGAEALIASKQNRALLIAHLLLCALPSVASRKFMKT